ncbi:sigma-70 family RNA polymerase sigma factor [Amycolatopsis sp.]|uniref:sigma-70 family RNA polymerase sigma factor n=1 Tax=Amycolatopsis sp. TaxID=37632 RepID=UPI002B6BD191|nr:sigma-70 family RNA polymerase sigma factor [Amycolatopsis sp.]HVV09407.1 sigma-70 family RNA polymerase sigma factor [Amycolatopsis sp.]
MALAEEFTALRPHLVSVAYRLTGSVSDAEDAVQESWLRLSGLSEAKRAEIRDLKGWLTTVVGRIGLDKLRSAAVQRERYVGQWLPEPIVTPLAGQPGEDPLEVAVRDEGLRMAAMVVLDKLSPEQRVAFVLHDAFSVPFAEISGILGESVETARQHASRGRRALRDAEPPPRASLTEQQEILDRFLKALLSGDVRGVTEALHPDAVMIGDSNGKARTAAQVIVGAEKIARFLFGLTRMYSPEALGAGRPLLVNGDLGLFVPKGEGSGGKRGIDAHLQTMTVRDGRIVAIYDLANPDKLTRVPAAEPGTPPRT